MKNVGITIEVLIEYVGLFMQGEETIATRKDILIEQMNHLVDKMEDMKNTIDKLNYKIEGYENAI